MTVTLINFHKFIFIQYILYWELFSVGVAFSHFEHLSLKRTLHNPAAVTYPEQHVLYQNISLVSRLTEQ